MYIYIKKNISMHAYYVSDDWLVMLNYAVLSTFEMGSYRTIMDRDGAETWDFNTVIGTC